MASAPASSHYEGAPFTDVTHLRGSGILLGGRVFAILSSGLVLVLLVRHLTRADFGRFAIALALAEVVHRLVSAGHGQCSSRFLALYDERKDRRRFSGTLLLISGAIIVASSGIMALGLVFRRDLGSVLAHGDSLAMTLALILVFYGASQALDDLLGNAFAVCSRPAAIFWRRYIIGPLIRLIVVIGVLVMSGGVIGLATGFLVTGVAGTVFYAWLLIIAMRQRGLLANLKWRSIRLPVHDLVRFSIPLMSAEVYNLALNSAGIVLLGAVAGPGEVAGLRAVLPLAVLNLMIIYTFTTMYSPLASRLASKGDSLQANDTYWRTGAWLVVLSFPVLALTVPLARPVTVGLLGHQYASSASVLAVLSVGYFANAAFGLNVATLIAFGRVRYLLWVNLGCASISVLLFLALVPRFGSLGVATGSTATVLLQNALAQWGMHRHVGVAATNRSHAGALLSVALAAAALWALELLIRPNLLVSLLLTAVSTLILLALNRNRVHLGSSFPELRRIPFVGAVIR